MRALEHTPVPGWVTRLPKADLHCHAEADARLEQIRARDSGRPAHNWRRAAARAMTLPPGLGRLFALDGELDKTSLLQLNESRE